MNKTRKKVIVFFSEGGGGHRSVAISIKDILEPNYNVELVLPMSTFLVSLDPIKIWTRKKFSGELLYNFFLKKRLFGIIRAYGYFGQVLASLKQKNIIKKTVAYLEKEKPDFLISDIPYFNQSFLVAAEKLNIPFMIVSCDLYTNHYLHGIKNPSYPKFYDTLFLDHPLPKSSKIGHNIPTERTIFSGFPVRLDFYEKKSKELILENLGIPKGIPILFILMGYFGSQSGIEYFKAIQKQIKIPVHIIIVLGREAKIHKIFNSIVSNTPAHISYTKIDFIEKISDLFFIADIVISKSGGLSTSEAIYMKKPIIVDTTKKSLKWEKMAGNFIEDMAIGYNATSYNKGIEKVNQWLNNPEGLKKIAENYKAIPDTKFSSIIFDTVNSILNQPISE